MHRELRNTVNVLLSKNARLNGRKIDEYRKITVETGISKNAEGSARVKIGETEVLAGIKMEVSKPYPDTPEQGGLLVNVELYPLSSPEFETGPPGPLATELARVTDRAIRESKCIDVKKLCITPAEKAWTIIIDIVSVNDSGNLFDAAALAAVAAVKDTKFPGFDGEKIDYHVRTDKSLPLTKDPPISVTVYKYGDKLLMDPDSEEEKVYDSRLSVGVLDDGQLCSLQKGGNHSFSTDDLSKMLDLAIVKAKELRKHM
ncbi:MAG: exosome complex protein Rrp42 [Nanoarchaeota archaeon]|nr:exosome complex protein Rrp42 [Nanoarchaeota archaeon]